ncbi:transposase [Catenibacterium mitsuokai]|uniref:transposase n=1 Tax=Catenibacterium mitsuokai TaxID=100886 RepID=UPI003F8A517B
MYYHIKALEVKPDHVYVFVDLPQTAAPCDVVGTFKDISAIELFKALPQLIQFYAECCMLWSRGYFVSAVTKYIEEQKNDN